MTAFRFARRSSASVIWCPDMDRADLRKARFRTRASCAKVAALALTGASTVVLGIPAIPGRAAIALPMVALVTLISALEPFYNWRSRGVLMEETQYRLNRIRAQPGGASLPPALGGGTPLPSGGLG
jgi:hypothetical protein